MIGQRSAQTTSPASGFAQVALPVAATAAAAGKNGYSEQSKRSFTFPFVLAGLVTLYFVYAIVERHEKLSGALKPANVAINFRNIVVLLIPIVLGLNLLKILGAKLVAWGIPGARYFLQIVAGA